MSIGIPIAVWASWTHFPDRYMIIPLAAWHALVPVALYRFWKRYAARFVIFPVVGGAFLFSQLDETAQLRQQQTSLQKNERMQAAQTFVQRINQAPGPVRDCTDIKLEAAFLPAPPTSESCADWIETSIGGRWIVINSTQRDELPSQWKIQLQSSQYVLAHHLE